jgi:hypothetical protein
MCAVWNLHITALTLPEPEAIIASGGFDTPVSFLQTLFICSRDLHTQSHCSNVSPLNDRDALEL